MNLAPGQRLGPFEIVAVLGAGGMGEVYKARDARLDRSVAIKVLPPELVRDPERVRRFVQEAKSASALSHPHIVTIHEIGESVPTGAGGEGARDAAALHYIAMELVEGRTLRQVLAEGETDLRTLTGWLAQAAEGLAKAHESGIVHRDVKPENVMVSRDGFAKVLDFGLAKLTEADEGRSRLADAPTAYLEEKTKEGTVLGTVGYMSPEQVRGKPLDGRSDIFSLGCILYEAATGTKAFAADSTIDVQHRILHDRPRPIEEANPNVPRALQRLILRCLVKEPEQRLQSMKDLALELREIVAEWEGLAPVASGATSVSGLSAPTPAVRRGPGPGVWIAMGLVVAALVAALVFLMPRTRGTPSAPPTAFQSMRIEPLTSSGRIDTAVLSADGRYLAYSGESGGRFSLRLRQVATGSDVEIAPPQEGNFPGLSFAPDGDYLYYTHRAPESLYSTLYQVPVLGGAARKLLFDIDTAVSFAPDGRQLAFVRGYPHLDEAAVMVAEASGAGERKLAVRHEPQGFPLVGPAWSPDGARIAAAAQSETAGRHEELVQVSVADAKMETIGAGRFREITGLAWLPDGGSLVVTAYEEAGSPGAQVWRVAFPGGAIARVTNDLNTYQGVSLAADGEALATVQEVQTSNLWLQPLGAGPTTQQLTFGAREMVWDVAAAASGTVVFAAVRGGEYDLWRLEAAGGEPVRLTRGNGRDREPAISRDGGTILFTSLREGGIQHVFAMDGDGGNVRQLTRGSNESRPALAPDGTWFAYSVRGPEGGLFRAPLGGGAAVRLAGPWANGRAAISPDGRRVAYTALREQQGLQHSVLEVVPAEGGTAIAVGEFEGERFEPRWTPDGRALSYVEWRGFANVWRLPLDGGPAVQLTQFASGEIFAYDWLDDGRLVLSRGAISRDVVLLRDFQ